MHCRHLITMQQVQGHQNLFQLGIRLAHTQIIGPKALQGVSTHIQQALQFLYRIGAVIPQMRQGMGTAFCIGIQIGDVIQTGIFVLLQNGGQPRCFCRGVSELAVAIFDGLEVPLPQPNVIGIECVQHPLITDFQRRMRVIHDRCPVVYTGRKIVGNTEGMSDFMCRQLAYTRQRQCLNRLI